MQLLDARRLQDHQFMDKENNSTATKNNVIADSYNQGFAALPNGGVRGCLEGK